MTRRIGNYDVVRHIVRISLCSFLLAFVLILCAFVAASQQTRSSSPKDNQHIQNNRTQNQTNESSLDKRVSKETQSAGSPENNTTTNYYQDPEGNKRTKEISDALLVLFTLALVVVGYLQYRALHKHETWMRKNVEIVTKIADAAKDNATAIEGQAVIMKGQLASMDGQLTAMQGQNRTLEESVSVARDAAKSAQASVETGIEKERARLKIIVEDIIPQTSLGVVVCHLENYGLTPGFISDFKARFLHCLPKDIAPDYTLCRQVLYAEALQPNERSKSFLIPLETCSDALSESDVMSIKKEEGFLHFYGFVTYRDVFKRDRRVTTHVRWKMRWGGTMPGMIMQWWDPVGLPEENVDE